MIQAFRSAVGLNGAYRRAAGFALMGIACCCLSSAAMIVKLLKNLNTSQILLYRSTFSLLLNMPSVSKESFFQKDGNISRILLIRLVFAGLIDFCLIGAYQYLKLSEAASILLTYPIVKCCFAKIFLEEPMKRPILIPFVLTLIGVLLIIQPGFLCSIFVSDDAELVDFNSLSREEQNTIRHQTFGYFLAIIFSFSLSTMDVIIFHYRRKIAPSVLVQYGYLGSILTSSLMIVWREYNNSNHPMNLLTLGMLFSAGVSYYLGQTLFSKALPLGRSKSIIPMTYLQIIIQIFVDIYVFDQELSPVSIAGSILIVFANIKVIAS